MPSIQRVPTSKHELQVTRELLLSRYQSTLIIVTQLSSASGQHIHASSKKVHILLLCNTLCLSIHADYPQLFA